MLHHTNPLAELIAENLISRLEFLTLKPKRIVDISLEQGQAKILLEKKYQDAEVIMPVFENTIALENQSVDLIFANLIFSFHAGWENVLADCRRILKPEGLLLISCLGLDTLPVLAEKNLLRPKLFDMHNIGDALVQNKFADPVLEVEHFTFQYRDREKFFAELVLNKMTDQLMEYETDLSAPYEVIYAHAFGPAVTADFTADKDGVVRVPVDYLRRK